MSQLSTITPSPLLCPNHPNRIKKRVRARSKHIWIPWPWVNMHFVYLFVAFSVLLLLLFHCQNYPYLYFYLYLMYRYNNWQKKRIQLLIENRFVLFCLVLPFVEFVYSVLFRSQIKKSHWKEIEAEKSCCRSKLKQAHFWFSLISLTETYWQFWPDTNQNSFIDLKLWNCVAIKFSWFFQISNGNLETFWNIYSLIVLPKRIMCIETEMSLKYRTVLIFEWRI